MKNKTIILLFVFAFFMYTSLKIQASTKLSNTLVIANNDLDQLLEKAEELIDNKKYTEAIEVFNEALKIATEKGLNNNTCFIYKNIGYIYYRQKEYVKAKEFYLKSIKSDSLSKNSADSHFNLAFVYRKEKQSDSLLFHLTKSLQIYSVLENSEEKYITYYNSGRLLRNNGNYDTAIKYLLKAYEGFDELDNDFYKARTCNAIAVTQRHIGNYDIAKQYYNESLKLRLKLGDKIEISFAYNNLGNLYRWLKKNDSARFYYEKVIEAQNTLKKTKKLGNTYHNLATVNYLEDNFLEAKKNYKKSIQIKKLEGDSLFLTTPYNELTVIAIKTDNKEEAKKYLDLSSANLNHNQSKDILERHYEVQSMYYEFIGDLNKALEYHKEYYYLSEQLSKQALVNKTLELQERFENKKKLLKIQELTQGNNAQKQVINQQEREIYVRNGLLLISFFLLSFAIVIYFLIKQRQKTREKGFEIQRLDSIFKEQEIVKSKISKDLHDIIITSFDAIRLKILALPKADNPSAVSKSIVSEIEVVNEEIRLISHRLSPLGNKIENSTLTEIILDQLTEFQYYRKIFVDIQLPLPTEINDFVLASQTNLYGIILETLNNIEKHAQATEVNITHKKKEDNISLSISDNGIGFQDKDKNGVGLLNIKQRAILLKGESTLSSTDKGATVTIVFPIKINTE